MVTLKDIAVRAGVSNATVSKVLNGGTANVGVSTKTRRRVERLASDMGYRINVAAQRTRTGKAQAVSLVLSDQPHRSTLPESLIRSLYESLAGNDLRLHVDVLSDERLIDPEYVPRILRELSCDGLLLNYHAHVPTRLHQLIEQYQIPAIWINAKQPVDSVYPDDLQAAAKATQWLIEEGHTRIAYCDAFWTASRVADVTHYSKIDRLAGYESAMTLNGLESLRILPEDAVSLTQDGDQCEIEPEIAAARQQIRAHVASKNPPTAWIGYSGMEVSLALFASLEAGLPLPQTIGFGPEPTVWSGLRMPTIRVPNADIARMAVAMLMEKMKAPATPIASRTATMERLF